MLWRTPGLVVGTAAAPVDSKASHTSIPLGAAKRRTTSGDSKRPADAQRRGGHATTRTRALQACSHAGRSRIADGRFKEASRKTKTKLRRERNRSSENGRKNTYTHNSGSGCLGSRDAAGVWRAEAAQADGGDASDNDGRCPSRRNKPTAGTPVAGLQPHERRRRRPIACTSESVVRKRHGPRRHSSGRVKALNARSDRQL